MVFSGDVTGPVITGDIIGNVTIAQPVPMAAPPPLLRQPPSVCSFVGRDAELASYGDMLLRKRALALVGPAGVGKSTLATRLAQETHIPSQVLWHTFVGDEGIMSLVWDLASYFAHHGRLDLWQILERTNATGGQLPPIDQLFSYVVQLVSGLDLLICLDDAHRIADDQSFKLLLRRLLELERGPRLLLTSRTSIQIAGIDHLMIAGLTQDDAQLLLELHGVDLQQDLTALLHEQTSGNAQLLLLGAEALGHGADQRQVIERLCEADDIERYLLAEVDSGLSPEERELMEVLSAFLGYPATIDALEALLDRGGLSRMLRNLCERHLLIEREGETDAYVQHALVQGFYYDLLSRRRRQKLHELAAAWYETEEPDLLRATHHHLQAGDHQRAAATVTSNLWTFINGRSAQMLRRLLHQIDQTKLPVRQWCAVLLARGQLETLTRDTDGARSDYERALALLASEPDEAEVYVLRARCCRGMGLLLENSDANSAHAWLQRGLEELHGVDALEAGVLHLRMGSVLMDLLELSEARAQFREALALLPPEPSHWRASTLLNQGHVACALGDRQRGIERYTEALAMYRALNNYWGVVAVEHARGVEQELDGDWAGAAASYEAALKLAEQIGSVNSQSRVILSMAILATRRGALAEAESLLERGMALSRGGELVVIEASFLMAQGDVALRRGDLELAAEHLARAEHLAHRSGVPLLVPETWRLLVEVALARGDMGQAQELLPQALSSAHDAEMQTEYGNCLRLNGRLLALTGDRAGAEAALRESLAILTPLDRYEQLRTLLALAELLVDTTEGAALRCEAESIKAQLGLGS